MDANLQQAGARPVIPSRSRHKLTELTEHLEALNTPREIIQAVDTGILMLPDAKAVESELKDKDGLLDATDASSPVIDMGTTEAGVTEELKSRLQALGPRFIDARVTGGRIGARDGTLVIVAGADSDDDFSAILPIRSVLGKNITHPGSCGSGQAEKTVNQFIAFSNQAALAEGMALARRSGLELNTLIPALTGGAANSIALQILGPRLEANDWSITAHISVAIKHRDIALKSARKNGLQLPGARAVRDQWMQAVNQIGSEHDIAEYVRFMDPDFSFGGWTGPIGAIGSGADPSTDTTTSGWEMISGIIISSRKATHAQEAHHRTAGLHLAHRLYWVPAKVLAP